MEAYIRQGLKNWAAQQHPPDNGRARLLLVAASSPSQQDQNSDAGRGVNTSSTASRPRSSFTDDVFQSQSQTWFWILHMTLTPMRHLP
jgi:hypothetical protein